MEFEVVHETGAPVGETSASLRLGIYDSGREAIRNDAVVLIFTEDPIFSSAELGSAAAGIIAYAT